MEESKATNVYDKLLSQKNCKFYTSIGQIALLRKLHDKIAPLVMKRYRIKDENTVTRGFKTTSKKMGPGRKLCSYDEFFIMSYEAEARTS